MQASELETVLAVPSLPPRPEDSNKGMFGRLLVVGGSRGMSGAAILCGCAALRGGAGLVRVAVPAGIQSTVASANPCYMTAALDEDCDGRFAEDALAKLATLAESSDVVVLGPGLGKSDSITRLVAGLLERARVPVVLDADGLNALVGHLDVLRKRPAATVLTPHPGEFSRLVGKPVAEVQAQRRDLAGRFAAEHAVVLALKGHGTIVTDGRRVYQNHTGNPGLASGGTGDVLAGVVGALIGQKLEPFAAAQLGVHVHGLAGDLARDDVGEIPLMATDLLIYLPKAFRTL